MGRRMTPTALRMLRGNPSRRPFNVREPEPGDLPTRAPKELTGAEARKEWRRTIAPAIGIGLVTAADRTTAIAHCELWATWRAQLALAAAGPEIVTGGTRYPTPNVARGLANKTLVLLLRIDSELGLTPASRSKVQVSPRHAASRGNPLERFLTKAAAE